MRYPVYVDGNISMQQLAEALASVGFHLRIAPGHRMVVDPIPKFLRKTEATVDDRNVVALPKRKQR